MPSLDLPNARLSYTLSGTSGPLLLLINGADGRGTNFLPLATILSSSFRVLTYDRRGYSGSLLIGSQNFENRLDVDADDAAALVAHVSRKGERVFVFGTSAGGVVAMRMAARHPDAADMFCIHEAPAFSVLPADVKAQAEGGMNQIYTTYRSCGVAPAMEIFAGSMFIQEEKMAIQACFDAEAGGDEIRANGLFFLEFEARQYTSAAVDMDALEKKGVGEKLVWVAGKDSGNGPCVGPVSVLAGRFGETVKRVAGGHIGYLLKTEEFAKDLGEILA